MNPPELKRFVVHLACKLVFLLAWGTVMKAVDWYMDWLSLDGTTGEIYYVGVLILEVSVLGAVALSAVRDLISELKKGGGHEHDE